jgi:type I restriction enzyme S subunit
MTPPDLLQTVDDLLQSPKGLDSLRRIIYTLAVQGRLSGRSSHDSSVEILARELSQSCSGKEAASKGYIIDRKFNGPIGVPSHWAWLKLSEICRISGGMTPSKAKSNFWNGDVNWFSPKDIKSDEVFDSELKITQAAVRSTGLQIYPPGCLLVVARSGILKRLLPVAINRVEATVNQDMKVLNPRIPGLERYLQIMLRGMQDIILTSLVKTGTTVQSLKYEEFESQLFPMPPLEEQQRIVAKVDELMALCNQLEEKQKEREERHVALSRAAIARFEETPTPANLRLLFHDSYSIQPVELRKSILHLAMRGYLSNSKASKGWTTVLLRDVCLQITDGEHATPHRVADGIPLATAKNVRDGYLDLANTDSVSLETAQRCWRRCKPQHGDLLMVCVGATTGRVCLAQNPADMVLVRSVALLRPDAKRVLPSYLELFLRSPEGQALVWANVKQSAQPCLYLGKIGQFEMRLPSLSEQHDIVAQAQRLTRIVDQLEAQLTGSDATARKLLDAVVHELLHPAADVIAFPNSSLDRASDRAAVVCYAVQSLAQNPNFGRTMSMKIGYLAEAHLGLSLGWQPERQAAGPWDPWISEFDAMGRRVGWFTVTEKSLGNGHTKYDYTPKTALKEKAAEAVAILGKQKGEFDRMLSLFADRSTEEAEIISTLFAAWNDFLIDGKSPSDDDIVREVRENWHVSKQRFTPSRLATWLKWMRDNRLVPQGRPPRTRQQFMLALS